MGGAYSHERRRPALERQPAIDWNVFEGLLHSTSGVSSELWPSDRTNSSSTPEDASKASPRTIDVAVVTQDEPFYMPLFYRSFFEETGDEVNVRWVTILDTFDESFIDTARRTYRLYGPSNFVRLGTRYLRRTTADRFGTAAHSVRSIAQAHGVPTEERSSVNASRFVDRIERENVDVLLSVSAPEIFDPEVLNAPDWGCINVHTAKLPKYRGLLPTFWALYHDDDEIGVTVHTMAEEIDRGKIVRQTTFPVGASPTLHDVIEQGKRVGGSLAAETLAEIAAGEESLAPMTGEESYFSFPTVEERREFQRNGGELL
jgi:methionyl-tRNA formyltransferase